MKDQTELWERMKAGDPDARDTLLESHMGLVRHVALKLARTAGPGVDTDDLVSAGSVGLIQAVEAYEPERGHAFSTFAVMRIRGAILDELRSMDWVPRSVRTKARAVDRAYGELESTLHRAVAPRVGDVDLAGVPHRRGHRRPGATPGRAAACRRPAPGTDFAS